MNAIQYYARLFLLWMVQLVGRLTGNAAGRFGFAGAMAVIVAPCFVLTYVLYAGALLVGGALDGLIHWTGHAPAIYHAIDLLNQAGNGISLKNIFVFVAVHCRSACAVASACLHHIHLFGGR